MTHQSAAPVILIDDDRDLLKATAQTLKLAGFSVSAFSMASKALVGIHSDFAGVVVSDIRMPEIDGFSTASCGLIPTFITGHGDVPMAVKAIKDGAYDFNTNPFATHGLTQLCGGQQKNAG